MVATPSAVLTLSPFFSSRREMQAEAGRGNYDVGVGGGDLIEGRSQFAAIMSSSLTDRQVERANDRVINVRLTILFRPPRRPLPRPLRTADRSSGGRVDVEVHWIDVPADDEGDGRMCP